MLGKLSLPIRVLAWPFLFVGLNFYVWVITPVRWLLSEPLRVEISEGEVFEVSLPMRVKVFSHWEAPFTGGFSCHLEAGVRLQAQTTNPAGARGCTFVPTERGAFQRQFAPEDDKDAAGFSILLTARQIRRHLRTVQSTS